MQYTAIGKIINTHGIKGELKIYTLTDDATRFDSLRVAYIGDEKLKVNVVGVKYNKEFPIIKLSEFNNINEVINFKEEYLFVDDENLVKLPENQYFIFQLIDCKVENMDGEFIGIVKDVIENPTNDVYVIRNNDNEYLVPAVKEFVKDVDVENKLIRIDPIEGMIE